MPSFAERYQAVRSQSRQIAASLSREDCVAQSMPDASPIKWHLAHTTWFFETFLVEPSLPSYRVFSEPFRVLFNSYYNSVGEQHPRPERGLITRPGLEEVLDYRDYVDEAVVTLCDSDRVQELGSVLRLGLEHERQHQELMLTDLKHLLFQNPLRPVYEPAREASAGMDKPLSWHEFNPGLVEIGADEREFSFDNERPIHRVWLEPFKLAARPVTNAEFVAFIEDDGYRRPELWLSDGWAWLQSQSVSEPLYWEKRDGERSVFTLSGQQRLSDHEPACHVSYYEADAYARWAAARLPTEAEWECVGSRAPVEGNLFEGGAAHPRPLSSESSDLPDQLFGDVWEWTSSPYAPYPGFVPLSGAFGEYNGKFMANQMVLRGGSCATAPDHIRASYRNFFYPQAQWQFSGLRLARDAD